MSVDATMTRRFSSRRPAPNGRRERGVEAARGTVIASKGTTVAAYCKGARVGHTVQSAAVVYGRGVGWLCAFGDSITWGAYGGPEGGWAQRLVHTCNQLVDRGLSEKRVHPLGIPGERIGGLLARFDVEANARDAEHFVIAIGANDSAHMTDHGFYPGTDPGTFALTYEAVLEKARRFSNDVVIVSPINIHEPLAPGWSNEAIAPIAATVRQIAEQHRLPFVDVFGALDAEDFQIDGIHPGPSGHIKLFEAIADLVAPQWRSL
jgi:lysophospholipase L1-like esterase